MICVFNSVVNYNQVLLKICLINSDLFAWLDDPFEANYLHKTHVADRYTSFKSSKTSLADNVTVQDGLT